MKCNGRAPVWSRLALPDLLASVALFGTASWIFSGRTSTAALIASATFWLSALYSEGQTGTGAAAWVRKLLTACGALFIVQAAALYLLRMEPLPPAPTLLSIAVLIAASALRTRPAPGSRPGVLFLGFDHAAGEMARSMGSAVVGFLHGNRSEVPPDLPYAGKPAQLAEVVRRLQPTRIVVAGAHSGDIPVAPRLLLDLRLSGIAIDDGLASYAEVFGRVLWREIERSPLHLLPRLRTQQFVMSLQAIYTNLAGLALLVLSLPGLIPAALAVKLLSGPGPVFERVECLGFQRVPFFMLRFRTRRADGKPAWIGRLLGRLRLVNLPQLVNVVRGEMAFIGPRPVRKEFGLRLGQLLDFYPARFICKPGMLGWSQIRLRSAVAPVDESVRLEYDLYYLQEAVPALDLEILIRSIFRHTSFSAINPR